MQLTEARVRRVVEFIQDQIPDAETALMDRHDRYVQYVRRYEAATTEKSWPWHGASSVHAPMVAIVMDAIKARVTNALFAQDRVINGLPLLDEEIPGIEDPDSGDPMTWRHIAELGEIYMNFEISDAGEVQFRQFVEDLVDEMLLLGTAPVRCYWYTEDNYDVQDDGAKIKHRIYDNVKMDVPCLENVVIPRGYEHLSEMPWFSYKYKLRPSEIRARVDADGWNKRMVRKFLEGGSTAELSDLWLEQEEGSGDGGYAYYNTDERTVYQSWLKMDLDGTGHEVRIVVEHSKDEGGPDNTGMFVFSIKPWPNMNGRPDFVAMARYNKRRKYPYGKGVPESLESLDEAYSTILNQMIDNGTLANTRLWSVNQNSVDAREFDTVYPGKKVQRGDDASDIQPLQMGEVYPSGYENLNIVKMLIEMRSKLTEYNLGREANAANGQATATATMALLQESGQYHDATTRDIRNVLNLVIAQWLDLLAQYKPVERVSQVLGPKAEPFLAALALPGRDLKKRIAFKMSFSNTAATRELARQEALAKNEAMKQYGEELLGLGQMRLQGVPALNVLVDGIARSRHKQITELLETFGVNLTTSTLPKWKDFAQAADGQAQQQMAQQEQMQAQQQQMMAQQAEAQQAQMQQEAAMQQQQMALEQQKVEGEQAQAEEAAELERLRLAEEMTREPPNRGETE